MSNNKLTTNRAGTVAVLLLSFLLFYFPSVVTLILRQNTLPYLQRLSFLMSTMYAAIFCLNYFVLIPKTLFEHHYRYVFYPVNAALICVAVSILPIWLKSHGEAPAQIIEYDAQTYQTDLNERYVRFALHDGVMMVFSIVLAYALQFSRYREKLRNREFELNSEQRQLEIRSLKMQLNPHFLFNCLNNIYALIGISPERAQEALHDLSGMLRYMIYDASASGVPLIKEMDFIDDFVRLSSLRMSGSASVSCRIDRKDAEGLTVAPLLYLTIIENAFKHYSPPSSGSRGYVEIDIEVDDEWVSCRVENTCADQKDTQPSGIGLSNIRRQLALLYAEDYTLECVNKGERYLVVLNIRRHAMKPKNK